MATQMEHDGRVTVAPHDLRQYTLYGRSFQGLAGFFDAVSFALGTKGWRRNLDAFNDILRGGFGTPDEGFVLRWANADVSAMRLGWEETILFIERKLTTCYPDNVPDVRKDLEMARCHEGQTFFEVIVQIVREHGSRRTRGRGQCAPAPGVSPTRKADSASVTSAS
jgi:hypothetical protein